MIITNSGPRIASTDYWGGDHERADIFFVSLNAGTFRVLVPRGNERDIMQGIFLARAAIVSRGPGQDDPRREMLELLFEDGSNLPYAIHVGTNQCDVLPLAEDDGREISVAVWVHRQGRPHCAQTLAGRYRVVPAIPWLKAWSKA